jgi:O-antigen/teichoic acid export membrane protein
MSVRRNLYWAFLQEYSVFIVNFISSIIIARLLKPDDFGVYALSYTVVAILMQLRQFGMGTYIVQSKELDAERVASALGVMYVISWTLGTIIILTSGWLAQYYNEPRLQTALIIVASTFYLAPLYQFVMAIMERRMEFPKLLRITLATTLITFIVSVGCAYSGLGYLSLPIGYASYAASSCIIVLLVRPADTILWPKLTLWREVLGFGSFTSGAGLVGTMSKMIPEVILGRVSTIATVGLYSRASSLAGILQMLIVNAITRSVNVSLAQSKRDGQALGPDYLNAVALATGLGWSAFALLAVVAKPVIFFLYGANWVSSAPFLTFVCIYQMMIISLVAYAEMMTLNGAYKRLFFFELCIGIFALVNFIFWSRIDPLHGAAGRLLEGIIFIALYGYMLTRLLKISIASILPIYGKSMLLALITITPALAFSYFKNWPTVVPFWQLVMLAVISGIAWVCGLFIVRHPLLPHVVSLSKQLWAKFRHKIYD